MCLLLSLKLPNLFIYLLLSSRLYPFPSILTCFQRTIDHDLHRQRRAALNPYFSTKSVARLEPTIQSEVNTLYQKLRDFSGSGKPVNLADAFTCLSADVIGAYAFGQQYRFLDRPNFAPEWRALMVVCASFLR
jgi:cytochrome P450